MRIPTRKAEHLQVEGAPLFISGRMNTAVPIKPVTGHLLLAEMPHVQLLRMPGLDREACLPLSLPIGSTVSFVSY